MIVSGPGGNSLSVNIGECIDNSDPKTIIENSEENYNKKYKTLQSLKMAKITHTKLQGLRTATITNNYWKNYSFPSKKTFLYT